MSKKESGRLEKRLDDWLEIFKSPVANWLSRTKQGRKANAAQRDEQRQQRQADWKEVSRAYLESRGLRYLKIIDKSWFLVEGERELLTNKDDRVSALSAPKKWLVYADTKTTAYPPANLNELLTTHDVDGFVWVSRVSTRAALRRSYRSIDSDSLETPHALFSLKDIDACVNLGATAGSKYVKQFRKRHSAVDYIGDAIGISLTFFGLYLAIVVAVHIQWSGSSVWRFLYVGYGIILLAGALTWIRVGFRELLRRFGSVLLLLGIVPVVTIGFAGTYNWMRDVILAVFIGLAVSLFLKDKNDSALLNPLDSSVSGSLANRQRIIKLTLWLAFTWVSLSYADRMFGSGWWFQQPLTTTPARFEETRTRASDKWAGGQIKGVAVSLSGGGYRAAILHAGVLQALEKLALPITTMGTISGGSIVGSFYSLGGSPIDFVSAVKIGRFNLKRELINVKELVHMACPARDPLFSLEFMFFCNPYGRSDVQAKLLDRVLLNETKLSQLPTKKSGAPLLIIGAVDLRTGDLLGFTRDALLRVPQSSSSDEVHFGRLPSIPGDAVLEALGSFNELTISKLVAGSGAFPGAINSIFLERIVKEAESSTTFNIADGGLADNYGLSLLLAAHKFRPEWQQKLIIVSDGSMPLEMVDDISGITEFFRAMDVVYASSGLDEADSNSVYPAVLRLSPANLEPRFTTEGKLVELGALSADRVERLLRTLPDSFLKERAVNSAKSLKDDIVRSTATFFRVTTLEDQFSMPASSYWKRLWGELDADVYHGKAQVDALFGLGQYLVYYHCAEITGELGLKDQELCGQH